MDARGQHSLEWRDAVEHSVAANQRSQSFCARHRLATRPALPGAAAAPVCRQAPAYGQTAQPRALCSVIARCRIGRRRQPEQLRRRPSVSALLHHDRNTEFRHALAFSNRHVKRAISSRLMLDLPSLRLFSVARIGDAPPPLAKTTEPLPGAIRPGQWRQGPSRNRSIKLRKTFAAGLASKLYAGATHLCARCRRWRKRCLALIGPVN